MKRKRGNKFSEIYSLIIRYIILVAVAIPNLWIFYLIFTPLTVYSVYFLLKLFFDVSLMNNILLVSHNFPIEIIKACVAGSAYYLLLILNLSIPKIKIYKRIKMILFSFSALFILNVLRIFLLSILLVKGISWFDAAHIAFWYVGSTLFVIAIWFATTGIFKIKEIPFYSDLKNLSRLSKKKSRRTKKIKKTKTRKKH